VVVSLGSSFRLFLGRETMQRCNRGRNGTIRRVVNLKTPRERREAGQRFMTTRPFSLSLSRARARALIDDQPLHDSGRVIRNAESRSEEASLPRDRVSCDGNVRVVLA